MTWTESLLRLDAHGQPCGKPYHARKRPYAELYNEYEEEPDVIVWRTHDVDVAVALAWHLWWCERSGEALPPVERVGWWRSVPWSMDSSYDYSIEEVRLPTDKGAVPAVLFSYRRWPARLVRTADGTWAWNRVERT